MKKNKCEQIADLNYYNHEQSNRVYGENGLSPTIRTGFDDAKGIKVGVENVRLVGGFGNKCNNNTQYHEQNRVYDSECLATSIPANAAFHPNHTCASERERESRMNLRIRKLVPLETMKLMGFEKKDEQAMREIGMTDSAIYHCAGDSIIVTCLMALFGQMLPISDKDLQQKIEKYVETLKEN